MRLTLRFIIPLIFVMGGIAYAVVPLVDELFFNKWFARDISLRTKLIASTMQDSLFSLIKHPSQPKALKLFNRVIQDERLYAIGLCDRKLKLLYKTQTFPNGIECESLLNDKNQQSRILDLKEGPLHVSFQPIDEDGTTIGELILIHDMSFLKRRSSDTKLYIIYFFTALGAIVGLLTVLIAQLSWKGWVNSLRSLLRGENLLSPVGRIVSPELKPIFKDLRSLIRDLESDRRARDDSQISWNPKTLKEILNSKLTGDEVLIVSNREPYIHTQKGDQIEIQFPASGLVTALEPIMRACSGTWIAHGSGNADRLVVDANDHVLVPPNHPSYRIRRVWLTPEQEKGYYYGFANEGLWALCHIAHVRPIFRSQDWDHYSEVNRIFADAVVKESKTKDPVVLVQDYHFALLPKLIKERLPNATVISFWHIPFPNPEVFGICPWREQLLEGLLGSDILGFHTRFHCNNFIDTVDRFLESRIDRDSSTISLKGSLTAVNHYPISIEFESSNHSQKKKSVSECRTLIRESNQLAFETYVGVGVDRLDYTKGILERFLAVERFLEMEPQWVGKFSFIQIAAPSRSSIEQYRDFEAQVRASANRINSRFSNARIPPITLKIEHHEPSLVYEYYRGADFCFVSSLHDGMNLVAKEFISAREDELGVLILSQFAGASKELPEALIVNPYDIDQCARAIHFALIMPHEEQRNRMSSMRGLIREFNVYRWAGRMLLDAARLRHKTRLFEKFAHPNPSEGTAS